MDDEAQLRQYQQQIQAAVNYAEQKKQAGEWSQEQLEEYLSYYYGEDWRETLRALNNQLSHKHPRKHLQTIMLLGSIVMVALIASLIAPFISVTGNTTVELNIDETVFAGQVHRISAYHPFTNLTLDAKAVGSEDLRIDIEDATGMKILGIAGRDRFRCNECEQEYTPPVMLHVEDATGSLEINQITYDIINK